jgi:hypothetical protein
MFGVLLPCAPDVCCNHCSYEPDPAFEEVEEKAIIDTSPSDSKEFWLIQWPKDKVVWVFFCFFGIPMVCCQFAVLLRSNAIFPMLLHAVRCV